ncbi:deoxycytidine triphosphate deaminase [Sphingobium sp. 3R8]|nr:deoxycytidine triphosphate deaminase [Sphingobium sp. 3R8]MBZ9649742.1 deoxycytidine triphosphate deaminase [Sphingobium sp. 3R8]
MFAAEKLDPAGYLLTMGGEVYVSPAKADKKDSVRLLKDDEAFFIPPGQFAFLLTEEVVKVPDDAFAFIALRSKSKFKGLVNVSGFHADPGFYGRLIFAVFNAGPGDVHLRRGDALFMVTFADLDEKTAKPRRDLKPQLNIPTDIILPIAGEIQSLAGLKANIDDVEREFDERLHAIERDVAILRWALALMLGAVVTLVVRMLIRP